VSITLIVALGLLAASLSVNLFLYSEARHWHSEWENVRSKSDDGDDPPDTDPEEILPSIY